MGFLRKTFYTIIGLPTGALLAEHFYTIKCVRADPTDRLPKFSPLVTRRMAENLAFFDRFERSVPITSLKAGTDNLDEATLARKLAKQIWLTKAYAPQKALAEYIFRNDKTPNANLSTAELEKAKIEAGMDVSNHLVLSEISGAYVQFEPKVPPEVDFMGPGGLVCVDVERRGENMVFSMECASIGVPTTGSLKPGEWLQVYLHLVYARLLLEGGVRRILHGGGE
jgi:hypothetical protein